MRCHARRAGVNAFPGSRGRLTIWQAHAENPIKEEAMSREWITVETKDGVATLTLVNPPLNL